MSYLLVLCSSPLLRDEVEDLSQRPLPWLVTCICKSDRTPMRGQNSRLQPAIPTPTGYQNPLPDLIQVQGKGTQQRLSTPPSSPQKRISARITPLSVAYMPSPSTQISYFGFASPSRRNLKMVVRARTPLAHIQYFLRPGGAAERSALLPRPSLALTHLYAVACRNPVCNSSAVQIGLLPDTTHTSTYSPPRNSVSCRLNSATPLAWQSYTMSDHQWSKST
jgi:hypothetical protein